MVAIADGGLLDGYRGINWSIPAFLYLDQLPNSTAPIPQQRSVWAALYSKVTAAPPVSESSPLTKTETISGAGEELRHVRTISLGVLEEILKPGEAAPEGVAEGEVPAEAEEAEPEPEEVKEKKPKVKSATPKKPKANK